MARNESLLVAPIPQTALKVGIPVAGLLFTLLFVALGFPYQALFDNLLDHVERDSGLRLDASSANLEFGLLGPRFAFESVTATQPSLPEPLLIDRLALRPAWSFSWLLFTPAVHIDAQTSMGNALGVVTLKTDERRWDGRLEGVDLQSLPVTSASTGTGKITGIVDADLDVSLGQEGVKGNLQFEARDGMLRHESLPIPLPYETLTGSVVLGGDQLARLDPVDLASPLLDVRITGTMGHAERLSLAPLALKLEFSNIDANLHAMIGRIADSVSEDGRASVEVGGTWEQLVIR